MSDNSNRRRRQREASMRRRLVRDVAERVPQPLDTLEIAAVIESIGITDEVARKDYGARDVFDLADRVFPRALETNAQGLVVRHAVAGDRTTAPSEGRAARLETVGRTVIALAPLLVVLGAVQLLSSAGWARGSVLAFSFGMAAAMLYVSGPILAVGRRTSIYLGYGYADAARRFLAFGFLVTAAGCLAVAAALFGGLTATGVFVPADRLLFTSTFIGWSLLWLLVASLSLARRTRFAAAGLALGAAVGVGLALGVGLGAGLVTGYLAAVSVLLAAWRSAYAREEGSRLRLPRVYLLALDAGPYAAFGSFFALFLLEPHVLGWEGHVTGAQFDALLSLELSFMLALPPVLLASPIYERVMRSFWAVVSVRRESDGPAAFRTATGALVAVKQRGYAVVAALFSVATVAAVELAVRAGVLEHVDQLIFLSAILGFFLLGIGQLSCLLMLSLSRPAPAVWSVIAAAAVMTLVGIPLVSIDFALTAPVFVAAAAVFAAAAAASSRHVMATVDYHYAIAF